MLQQTATAIRVRRMLPSCSRSLAMSSTRSSPGYDQSSAVTQKTTTAGVPRDTRAASVCAIAVRGALQPQTACDFLSSAALLRRSRGSRPCRSLVAVLDACAGVCGTARLLRCVTVPSIRRLSIQIEVHRWRPSNSQSALVNRASWRGSKRLFASEGTVRPSLTSLAYVLFSFKV